MNNPSPINTPQTAITSLADGSWAPRLLRRIEWLCLLNALLLVVLVYPLRLKDAWLGAFLRTTHGWPKPWGDLLAGQLEPFIGFLYSPLVLKGCLAGIMLTAFIGTGVARRLLEPLDTTAPRRPPFREPLAWASVLALFGWIMLSFFWSPTPLLARAVAFWAAVWGLSFYLLLRRGLTRREAVQAGVLLIAIGTAVIVVLYLEALPIFGGRIVDFMVRFEDKRNLYGSLLGHNTAAASYLLLTAFPSLAFMMTSRRVWVRIFCVLYLAALILSLLLLQSRAIWIFAPVLGLLALRSVLRAVRFRWARWLPTALLGIGLLALLSQVINQPWNPLYVHENPLGRRLHDLSPEALMNESRLRLNWIGIQMVPEHPFIGQGLYAYQYVYPPFQGRYFIEHPDTPLVPTIKRSDMAHDEYLQLTIDQGLIGLALMIWLLVEIVRRGRRIRRRLHGKARLIHEAFGWSSLAFLLHACVDFPFHIPQIALPGMICLAAWSAWREPGENPAPPDAPPGAAPSAALFRPGHFLRLLGALIALGAIPVAVIPFGRAITADVSYKRGDGLIQDIYTFGDKIPAAARQDILRNAIRYYSWTLNVQPSQMFAHMQMGDAYRLLAQLFWTEAQHLKAPGQAANRRQALDVAQVAIQDADKAMTLAGKTLNFHGLFIQRARIYELMNVLMPGQGYDQLYRDSLKKTLQYCPSYGWAANLLARDLAGKPGADPERIAKLRRVLYRYQTQDFYDAYIVPVTTDLENRLYDKAVKLYEEILLVDPRNQAWLGATAYAEFMVGNWTRCRQLFTQLNQLKPRALYETGSSLLLFIMDGRWYDALVEMAHIPAATPQGRAEMRALEIQLQQRCTGHDLSYGTFYTRPEGMDEALWQARVQENRPWVLLRYLRDAQAARRAFDERLTLDVPPERLFWITGLAIARSTGDTAMAGQCMEKIKSFEPNDFVVRDLEKEDAILPEAETGL